MKLLHTTPHSFALLFLGNPETGDGFSLVSAVFDGATNGIYLFDIATPMTTRSGLGLEWTDTAGWAIYLLWVRIYLQPGRKKKIERELRDRFGR